MDRENRYPRKDNAVFSKRVRAGRKRTYFFDVRITRGSDYYLTITESKRRFDTGGFERHKLHLYKEDFNKFLTGLEEAVNHVKTELMPDYDFDEFTRDDDEEYERNRQRSHNYDNEEAITPEVNETDEPVEHEDVKKDDEYEDEVDEDLSW